MPDYNKYAKIILPLAVPNLYTYGVPPEDEDKVEVGMRVEVQFGKRRHYSGIISEISNENTSGYKNAKPVLEVLDDFPIITEEQLRLWNWIADYYCCTVGEVMTAALPSSYRLISESRIIKGERFEEDFLELDDRSYLIHEALQNNEYLSIQDLQDILQIQGVFGIVNELIKKKIIKLEEVLLEKYRSKTETCIRFIPPFDKKENYEKAFALTENAPKQTDILLTLIDLTNKHDHVIKTVLQEKANASSSIVNSLIDKQIVEKYELRSSRVHEFDFEKDYDISLAEFQSEALTDIQKTHKKKTTALLHGLTGSGKTEIYVEYIRNYLTKDEQVLYLVPEIALTTQLTKRLARMFGNDLIIYHSKLNNQERVEIWESILRNEKKVIVSARSGLLLPFQKLGLIIVDEEHDHSFKQFDPAPRYHARDTAVYAANKIHHCPVILGSATPSLESFFNADQNLYGKVSLTQRYGNAVLPEIEIVRMPTKKKVIISKQLQDAISHEIQEGFQVIIFKNRRGYAPRYSCSECDWHAECINCDVSLTYHQNSFELKCHYCGYRTNPPRKCPVCTAATFKESGIGTEKIEEELSFLFPEARLQRLDSDTTRGKYSMEKIVTNFQLGKIDILIGTQMVSKGLDFLNVRLVGVIDVESLFQFPDFRSHERSYQLLRQVSGRSGRGEEKGKVLIQARSNNHPVLETIVNDEDTQFYRRELAQRKTFAYPPYVRLINIHFEHKSESKARTAAQFVFNVLSKQLKTGVLGPTPSRIARLKNRYRYDVFLKLQSDPKHLKKVKKYTQELISHTNKQSGMSNVRIFIDVDPYA